MILGRINGTLSIRRVEIVCFLGIENYSNKAESEFAWQAMWSLTSQTRDLPSIKPARQVPSIENAELPNSLRPSWSIDGIDDWKCPKVITSRTDAIQCNHHRALLASICQDYSSRAKIYSRWAPRRRLEWQALHTICIYPTASFGRISFRLSFSCRWPSQEHEMDGCLLEEVFSRRRADLYHQVQHHCWQRRQQQQHRNSNKFSQQVFKNTLGFGFQESGWQAWICSERIHWNRQRRQTKRLVSSSRYVTPLIRSTKLVNFW